MKCSPCDLKGCDERPCMKNLDVQKVLDAFRWLQHGNVHLYVMYILITLLTLMFWKLR